MYKGKGKVVPLHAKQAQRGSRGIAPPILDPGSKRMWVVSATTRPLCPRERDPGLIVQERTCVCVCVSMYVYTWIRRQAGSCMV